jgi:thymidine kinase
MSGTLTSIIGPMFSGKSSYMVNVIERYHRAKRSCLIIKHATDLREGAKTHVQTHAGYIYDLVPVIYAGDLRDAKVTSEVARCSVIGIDEIQFFAMHDVALAREVAGVIEDWLRRGKIVVCAGLDTDWMRAPFSLLAPLIAISHNVVKLLAVCRKCGADAPFSARCHTGDGALYSDPVGGDDKYMALCRSCYYAMADEKS